MDTPQRNFLRWDQYPQATRLLVEALPTHVFRAGHIEREDAGLSVCWDAVLDESPISTTEEAVVHIARGIAIFERHGAGDLWTHVMDVAQDVRP